MPDAPPAIIMPAPDVPASFRLENLDDRPPLTGNLIFVETDCPLSEGSDIVVCGRRGKKPDYRIETKRPPPLLDEIEEPLVFKSGPFEFGLGRKGLGFRFRF